MNPIGTAKAMPVKAALQRKTRCAPFATNARQETRRPMKTRPLIALSAALIPLLLPSNLASRAQSAAAARPTPLAASAPTAVPALVPYSGVAQDRSGKPLTGEARITFQLFENEQGGDPLWLETETVEVDAAGHYAVQLGASSPAGLPLTTFVSGEGRWLEVEIAGQEPQPRIFFSSVPYAMKSADAESLAGHSAADFVTQAQLAQLAASAEHPAPQASPGVSPGPITGGGTARYVPLWTGSATLGNSPIVVSGVNVGIGTTAPVYPLDVNGIETLRGGLKLETNSTATPVQGVNSSDIEFETNTYSSTTKAAIPQYFILQADSAGNNTANPSAVLALSASAGGAAPAATGLSFGLNGRINFAPGQTFPGTIAGITTSSPLTGGGGSGSVALGLDQSALVTAITPTLETAFNTKYAQLGAQNNFALPVVAFNTAGGNNAALNGIGLNGNIGAFGASDTAVGVLGTTQSGASGVLGNTGGIGSASNTYVAEKTFQSAGVWGDTTAATGSQYAAGVIGTADNADGGTFFNNSKAFAAVYAQNLGAGTGLSGNAASTGIGVQGAGGTGVYGTSNSSAAGAAGVYGRTTTTLSEGVSGIATNNGSVGVYGEADGSNSGTGSAAVWSFGVQGWAAKGTGVIGTSNGSSAIYLSNPHIAGVWGDAGGGDSSTAVGGVVGTADDLSAGFFENNSDFPTVYAYNQHGGVLGTLFKALMASTATGTCGIGGDGDLACTGQIKALVKTGGARTVETYATQSAENWMEDYGTGEMKRGVAVVTIDPAFAETVSETAEYHVFLTPNADSKGLYVIHKTGLSFEVRESSGGTSSLTFDWKIAAKRRGYEAQRLVDVTDRFNAAMTAAKRTTSAGAGASPAALSIRRPQPAVNPTQQMPAGSGGRKVPTLRPVPAARPGPATQR
jgi:hypothetical protein